MYDKLARPLRFGLVGLGGFVVSYPELAVGAATSWDYLVNSR